MLLSFLKDQTGGKSAFCQLWVSECAQEVCRAGQEKKVDKEIAGPSFSFLLLLFSVDVPPFSHSQCEHFFNER